MTIPRKIVGLWISEPDGITWQAFFTGICPNIKGYDNTNDYKPGTQRMQ